MHSENLLPNQYCQLAREFRKAGCSDRQVLRMLLNSIEKMTDSHWQCCKDRKKKHIKSGGEVGK